MGLAITVGVLADLSARDPEGAGWIRDQFSAVNAALAEAGLPQHQEPEACPIWSAEGYGYSGLHALREVAGLTWREERPSGNPRSEGKIGSAEEELFEESLPYLLGETKPSLWKRLFGVTSETAPPPFIHLVAHSDAEGFYVPIEFPIPVSPETIEDETASIWPLGSVQGLHEELRRLAEVLEIPHDLQSDDPLVETLLEDGGKPDAEAPWQRQLIASHSLLILREACTRSLATGAAIHFG